MKIFVIDACALIAYLFDEEGSDFFQNMLIQARNREIEMVMHFANLGEVYYDTLKRNDTFVAQEIYRNIKKLPVKFESGISDQMIYKIGELKTAYRISYADAFAASLAILLKAELLTSDHKEFEPLKQAGAVNIAWLR